MTVTLYPFQDTAVNASLAYFQRGMQQVILASGVGTGKTTMGMSISKSLLGLGKRGAWMTHRQELRHQASARAVLFGIPFGEIAPGSSLTGHHFHIASIDTVNARFDALRQWLADLDFVVFDEAHHILAESWMRVAEAMPKAQLLLLSGTPYRKDGKGFGEMGRTTGIVRTPPVKLLTEAGYLAPAQVYAPPTGLDLSRVGKRGGDYVLSQIAALTDTDELSILARRWYAKMSPGQPAIVFCTTVKHAENVAQAFAAAGWRARSVDGTMKDRDRDAAISGLADGSVHVLTSCDLISEGTDIPAVSTAILLRPTASTGLYVQQVGRALRTHADKSHATILDLVGNVAQHGMPDADRPWDLRSGLKGLERAVAATWRCRKCHRVHSRPSETAIMSCGCGSSQKANGIAPAQVDNMPGVNGIPADTLFRMKLGDAVKHCKTLDDYKRLGTIKGYKPGWALQTFMRA